MDTGHEMQTRCPEDAGHVLHDMQARCPGDTGHLAHAGHAPDVAVVHATPGSHWVLQDIADPNGQ
jgi:hypothetical protein